MKNIVIIHKEKLVDCPPLISTIMILKDLGYNLTLISIGISDYWKKELNNMGIVYFEKKESGTKTPIRKVFEYYKFRKYVVNTLNRIYPDKDCLLWVTCAPTILSLGTFIKDYRYILMILELHENSWYQKKAISRVINSAELVFMPEYNRTVMYQIWFKMKKRAIVLPNKPYFVPSEKDIQNHILPQIKQQYEKEIELFQSKKVILFQGWYGKPNRDLTAFVQAIKDLGDDFRLAIMGRYKKDLDEYRAIDPNIIHIDFIPAPDYMAFTSLAYIGVVSYNPNSLNNAYCAPNKIWEYSTFSLPMLCNDIPGLKYTVEYSGAGICVDENDCMAIKKAIQSINENYGDFSKNSLKMNQEVDNKLIIAHALSCLSCNQSLQ